MSELVPGAGKRIAVAFAAGVIFAVGLTIGGMTLPSKVVGFLDVVGTQGGWDPSLAFVMGGGLLVFMPVFQLVRKRQRPLLDMRFRLPTAKDIDARLIGGGVLFGLGWGLGGFCPGPALTSFGAGLMGASSEALVFVPAMLAGMASYQAFQRARGAKP
ncbi:MAG: DUF6691 family protein [Myxococcota bacterium]